MKDSKDFDVNQFVSDGKPTESTAANGDAQPSKRTVLTATTEPDAPTVQSGVAAKTVTTPSSEQTVKPRQTVSTSPSEQSTPSQQTASVQSTELSQHIELPQPATSTQPTQPQRTSAKHRRASLDEYREAFMAVPKIIDRQPVFVSREVRDRIDSAVRRLGERKMSVSGFLENLARHHLNMYADDLEQWKRL